MGDQPEQPEKQQLEQFPPPPSFYKLYDPSPNNTGTDKPLPPKPPPVIQGEYDQYGELHTTEDGVVPMPEHIQKLFSSDGDKIDFKAELQKLNKETLFTFLELLNTLTESPGLTPASRTQYDMQMMSLGVLMWNMHYLLNLMRPHQARATLEHALQEQIEERKSAIRALQEKSDAAEQLLAAAATEVQAQEAKTAPQVGGDLDQK